MCGQTPYNSQSNFAGFRQWQHLECSVAREASLMQRVKYQQRFCNTEFGSLKFTPQELGND